MRQLQYVVEETTKQWEAQKRSGSRRSRPWPRGLLNADIDLDPSNTDVLTAAAMLLFDRASNLCVHNARYFLRVLNANFSFVHNGDS